MDAPLTFSVYIDAGTYPQILDQACRDLVERAVNDRLVHRQRTTVEHRGPVWRFRAPTTEVLRDNPILFETFLDHLRTIVAGILAEYERLAPTSARDDEPRGKVA